MKELCANFIKVCKEIDYWPYNEKNDKYKRMFETMELSTVPLNLLEKYRKEVEDGKEQLLFKSERECLSPFLPLCMFPQLGTQMSPKSKMALRKSKINNRKSVLFEKDNLQRNN